MADAEKSYHKQVAEKIAAKLDLHLRRERTIVDVLYAEYGGRLSKSVGDGTGESCSGCGRANTWHPECPTCEKLTELETKLEKAREALGKIRGVSDSITSAYAIAARTLKEIGDES